MVPKGRQIYLKCCLLDILSVKGKAAKLHNISCDTGKGLAMLYVLQNRLKFSVLHCTYVLCVAGAMPSLKSC